MTVTFVPKTGTFTATQEEILEMARHEHEWKMDGLARAVLKMPTKVKRQAFLMGFEAKHGEEIANDLKRRIIAIHNAGRP